MEFIFPFRLGFHPVLLNEAMDRPDWSGLMLEIVRTYSAEGRRKTRSTLNRALKDERASTIRSLFIPSQFVPLLVEKNDRLVGLQSVFLEEPYRSVDEEVPKEEDPALFMEAFPGLRRIYIKRGMEATPKPLRHIGLEYLGLPIESLSKKRLSDLVMPNLTVLSIRLNGFPSRDPVLREELMDDLLAVMTGRIFPNLERLYLGYCDFINMLIQRVFLENREPITIKKLDLIDSSQFRADRNYGTVSQDLSPLAFSNLADKIEITTDNGAPPEVVRKFGESLRTGVGLLPY